MKVNLKEIRNIENKYGFVLFRMGLSHLVDVGHRNLSDENVEESVQQIMAQGEVDKEHGKISIMTPEFQCEVVRCAAELSQFSIWTLFAYIKKHAEGVDLVPANMELSGLEVSLVGADEQSVRGDGSLR